jgi:gamma-glutamyltranspeptidase / glutathione hydrolase
MAPSLRLPSSEAALLVLLSLAVVAGGCRVGGEAAERGPAQLSAASVSLTDPASKVVRSPAGVVSSGSVLASQVGASVLAEGGGAVDAAIATSFALLVAEPTMSGLGGRVSILVRTSDGRVFGIDGLNQVPSTFREGGGEGYERAAIPGHPAAMGLLHDELGSWGLRELLAPAVALAEGGVPLTAGEARRLNDAAEDLRRYPGAADFLAPGDAGWRVGDRFRQPTAARTLRAIAEEGVRVVYEGWVADSIAVDMERNGGFITRDELRRYRALEALPVGGRYRNHVVLSNFRPSSGHTVIQALQTMELLEAEGDGELRGSALLAEALRHALDDRHLELGSEEESAVTLTSPDHARERAASIELALDRSASVRSVPSDGGDGSPLATAEGGVPPSAWAAGAGPQIAAPQGVVFESPGDRESTSHFSVVDGEGTVVLVTQSLGPSMGTRVISPGVGFPYATRLGDEPGSRPTSAIAPTLVLDPEGEFLLALGGAGDDRIISAVTQVIHRVVGQGMELPDAVGARRVHPVGDRELRVEAGPVGFWTPDEVEVFSSTGRDVVPTPSSYFGRIHGVGGDGTAFVGVAEARWDGSAVAPLR